MARKTKDEALATRSQIPDAAERVFGERGVARTSLHEIAESAGLTRGAVYWHFKDKYDLLSALWERCRLPLEAAFAEIDAQLVDDPLARIRQKTRGVARSIVHDPRTRNMMGIALLRCEMVDEIAASRARLVGERDACLDKISSEFAAAIEQGQLRKGTDARAAAISLHALIDGLCYHWLLDPAQFDYEAVVAAATDQWLAGLGAVLSPGKAGPRRPARRR
ncbi:MAG: TetR family transcriptional regulator [Planctomycetes bacterium]|nr:TetR family transcriptional regulator [Planctomycetota bacterium]